MITNEQLMEFKESINKGIDKLIKENIRFEVPEENQIKIGDQIWMNINLHCDDDKDGIYHCDYNDEYYYSWNAAMRVAKLFPGWHLPSKEDWDKLEIFIEENAGTKLKSKVGWSKFNGTDEYKFNAKPSGYHDGSFRYLGSCIYFWTSDEYNRNDAYCRYLSTKTTLNSSSNYKTLGFLVRLVKDPE